MWIWGILSKENVIKMMVTGLPTLVIALIISFISIRLALKQFYSQKWWETKSTTYSKILGELSNYIYALERNFGHELLEIQLTDEAHSKYSLLSSNAYDEIRKITAMGSFIISVDAYESLKKLTIELEYSSNEGNWVEEYEHYLMSLRECLDELRRLAKVDLRV